LICLHPRTALSTELIFDDFTSSRVKPVRATLIITPPSILEQWRSELQTHAPSLKVMHYTRMQSDRDDSANQKLMEELAQQDVVLITYQVAAHEIHFAQPPPNRSLRHAKRFQPRRSPLVQLSWWRVCLDGNPMPTPFALLF
jgi:E3 ubiquitin-protein ligase SHPRH